MMAQVDDNQSQYPDWDGTSPDRPRRELYRSPSPEDWAQITAEVLAQQTAIRSTMNVQDFGAVGDGITDDTAAFQACATKLKSLYKLYQPSGGSGEAYFPTVLIPNGKYKITAPISWGAGANLVGNGFAVVLLSDDIDGFQFLTGYQISVSNIAFSGGARAIVFQNDNINGARLDLFKCRFQNQTDVSVSCTPLTGTFFSSHITLDKCKWFGCNQALLTWADINTVSDGWLQWKETDSAGDLAYIDVFGGKLNVLGTMFVPVFPTDNHGCTWIRHTAQSVKNGESGITCINTQFHGEYGGLPPVAIVGSPDTISPFQGTVLTFLGCQLSCGATARDDTCLVQLLSGMFQSLSVMGCSGIIGPCPLILDINEDAETIYNALSHNSDRVRIYIGANAFYPLDPPVPTFLESLVKDLG